MWYFHFLIYTFQGWIVILHSLLVLIFFVEHLRRYKRISKETNEFCIENKKNRDSIQQAFSYLLKIKSEIMKRRWLFPILGFYTAFLSILILVKSIHEMVVLFYIISGPIDPTLFQVEGVTAACSSLLLIAFITSLLHIIFVNWANRIISRAERELPALITIFFSKGD